MVLPLLIAGGVVLATAGATLFGYEYEKTQQAQQQTAQAQIDYQKSVALRNASPESQANLTGNTISYTLREYAPYIALAIGSALVLFYATKR